MSNTYPHLLDIRLESTDYESRSHDRVVDVQVHWYDEDGHRTADSRLAGVGGPSEFSVSHRGFDSGGPELTLVGGEWLDP